MGHTKIVSQSQSHIHVQSKIDDFFSRFKIATLMHRCGIANLTNLGQHQIRYYMPLYVIW
jgi:hypothetical protein